ncbi:CobB/CobQ-like glutamine amidotransferase domain-containing protein [Ochromonadaceae sp. CCMP2298]|nr:CobB/CobQ-like glutamine amidotransferase domain-containing protein [Ochromonadaceae sp. CCMP2298]
MIDLLSGAVTLDTFRGLVLCGGFSYADVNDSAKGWAGVIKFNPSLWAQFEGFKTRSDTFSLGVCNGCQLLALLVEIRESGESGNQVVRKTFSEAEQARFTHNASGRFESRWSCVKILPSKAVLLQGMEGSSMGVWVSHGEGKVHI